MRVTFLRLQQVHALGSPASFPRPTAPLVPQDPLVEAIASNGPFINLYDAFVDLGSHDQPQDQGSLFSSQLGLRLGHFFSRDANRLNVNTSLQLALRYLGGGLGDTLYQAYSPSLSACVGLRYFITNPRASFGAVFALNGCVGASYLSGKINEVNRLDEIEIHRSASPGVHTELDAEVGLQMGNFLFALGPVSSFDHYFNVDATYENRSGSDLIDLVPQHLRLRLSYTPRRLQNDDAAACNNSLSGRTPEAIESDLSRLALHNGNTRVRILTLLNGHLPYIPNLSRQTLQEYIDEILQSIQDRERRTSLTQRLTLSENHAVVVNQQNIPDMNGDVNSIRHYCENRISTYDNLQAEQVALEAIELNLIQFIRDQDLRFGENDVQALASRPDQPNPNGTILRDLQSAVPPAMIQLAPDPYGPAPTTPSRPAPAVTRRALFVVPGRH